LWFKEAFLYEFSDKAPDEGIPYQQHNTLPNLLVIPHYRATEPKAHYVHREDILIRKKWKPSIYMPKWVSRMKRRIVKVFPQRVQDISPEDAIAEGVNHIDFSEFDMHERYSEDDAVNKFAYLWNKINNKPKRKMKNGKILCYTSYPWTAFDREEEHMGKPHYIVGNPVVWVIQYEVA
jgi:hypothetical protein